MNDWTDIKEQLQTDFAKYMAAIAAQRPRPISLLREMERVSSEIPTTNRQEFETYYNWWATIRPAWLAALPPLPANPTPATPRPTLQGGNR